MFLIYIVHQMIFPQFTRWKLFFRSINRTIWTIKYSP